MLLCWVEQEPGWSLGTSELKPKAHGSAISKPDHGANSGDRDGQRKGKTELKEEI